MARPSLPSVALSTLKPSSTGSPRGSQLLRCRLYENLFMTQYSKRNAGDLQTLVTAAAFVRDRRSLPAVDNGPAGMSLQSFGSPPFRNPRPASSETSKTLMMAYCRALCAPQVVERKAAGKSVHPRYEHPFFRRLRMYASLPSFEYVSSPRRRHPGRDRPAFSR
jgi:hypothetical protein